MSICLPRRPGTWASEQRCLAVTGHVSSTSRGTVPQGGSGLRLRRATCMQSLLQPALHRPSVTELYPHQATLQVLGHLRSMHGDLSMGTDGPDHCPSLPPSHRCHGVTDAMGASSFYWRMPGCCPALATSLIEYRVYRWLGARSCC